VLENTNVGCRTVSKEDILPMFAETVHALSIPADDIDKRWRSSFVDLIEIYPETVGTLSGFVLHRLGEAADCYRVIVNHYHIWVYHLEIVVNLIEAEPFLLGVLVCCCVVAGNPLRNLANSRTSRMALEAKVEGLYLRCQCRELAEKCMRHLRIPGRLIDVCTNENETH